MLSLARLETETRRIVNAGIQARKALEEILAELDNLFLQQGILSVPGFRPPAVEDLLSRAASQHAWITSRIASPIVQDGIAHVLGRSAAGYARMGGRIRGDVARLVTRSLQENLSRSEISNHLEATMNVTRNQAATIAQTGTAAFDRIGKIQPAIESGVKRFRYVGPSAERRFCQRLLAQSKAGQTWTVEEIRKMDNGQGLSVLYDCGGYHCRHDWEGVYE